MCLAVPMELVEHNGFRGVARLGGVSREINLLLVPDVKIGDYVIIHAGCAISVLSRDEAQKTIDLLRGVDDFKDLGRA
ncbi:MAG: HypC/HybG/HupF family hydrogenase formation chaperone [Nitrospinae bacterium]|nr:HypC/HybG/HupF family hydrogenase formation chaperone [Nitrospinota bacterium]